jgi:hypothetical protein
MLEKEGADFKLYVLATAARTNVRLDRSLVFASVGAECFWFPIPLDER